MTKEEQRLQMVTDQLILVRDNLFRGMSKSIQKLQARSINEVLGLETFIGSATPPAAQRQWVGLTDEEIQVVLDDPQKYYDTMNDFARAIEAKLKEKNT